VLRLDGLRSAAVSDFFFFILDLFQEFHHVVKVFLELRRVAMDLGFKRRV
jgi:hypothetical protein